MIRRFARTLILLPLSVLATGCPPPPNYVQVEWDKTMRQMGIVPTFPPREDVFVGDVYATTYDPESADTQKKLKSGDLSIGINPRWAHVDFRPDMIQEYRRRPSGPLTPATYSTLLTDATTLPTTEPTNPNGLFTPETLTTRNRIVGFPEFTSVTFTQGNLSALVPVEAVSIGFGASSSDFESVTIKLPSAESIAVDASQALHRLVAEEAHAFKISDAMRFGLTSLFPQATPTSPAATPPSAGTHSNPAQPPAARYIWLRLVTEVYYARVVDVSATSKTSNGFQVTGKLTAATGQPTTQPILNPNDDSVARAKALNDALSAAGASNFPNGSVQFVTATDRTISLRRIYTRPVAFGFRGLTLKVDADTGVVMGIEPSHGQINLIK